jgi:hypothetical protein
MSRRGPAVVQVAVGVLSIVKPSPVRIQSHGFHLFDASAWAAGPKRRLGMVLFLMDACRGAWSFPVRQCLSHLKIISSVNYYRIIGIIILASLGWKSNKLKPGTSFCECSIPLLGIMVNGKAYRKPWSFHLPNMYGKTVDFLWNRFYQVECFFSYPLT